GASILINKRTPIEGYDITDIDTLCRESDIITVHCPLNDTTYKLIDERRLSLMKPEVILVNEARGAVIDEAAISAAILDKRIGAFGSDVYTTEPFDKKHPFWQIKELDNVCLTPHCAWGAYESRLRCFDIICANIESFLSGKRSNRVDC
ncbi:MAG: D-2-hydroxyacid dehydrogenase, partial [Clostridia bacterium]|nr:D-2-hydroxyacid dehydrogenase [Clostridia bacterium]